jgi:hypothetical protein
MKNIINRIYSTLLNKLREIKLEKHGIQIAETNHKCSARRCNHWARYTWIEEIRDRFSGKEYVRRRYGCYFHVGI